MPMTWLELEEAVRQQRSAGVITMQRISRSTTMTSIAAADELARAVGYKPLGNRWVPLSPDDATIVLLLVLERDLAYGESLMDRILAERLAVEFLGSVGEHASFFTNGSWAEPPLTPRGLPRGQSWEPLSHATIDAGVLGVGPQQAAILWAEDED